MGSLSKKLGDLGEEIALKYLTSAGYQIIERNFHSSQGEIDLIAREGEFLVFIEVKSYSFRSFGPPLGAVKKGKKESIIHAARTYLYKKEIKNTYCRFDVLAIYRDLGGSIKIELIKDAFRIKGGG